MNDYKTSKHKFFFIFLAASFFLKIVEILRNTANDITSDNQKRSQSMRVKDQSPRTLSINFFSRGTL